MLPKSPTQGPALPASLSRILAVRLDNISNGVMLGPARRALRGAYPETHITLMASPGGSQVVPLLTTPTNGACSALAMPCMSKPSPSISK